MFLNGVMIFDLTIGLLLCLISSVKGANYCLPFFLAIVILIFMYNEVIYFILHSRTNMCLLFSYIILQFFSIC